MFQKIFPGFAVLVLIASTAAAEQARTVTVNGITRPSHVSELSFAAPGTIRERVVKEGDRVTAGQPLLIQDDRMEAKLLEILELEATSTHHVDAATADMEVKKVALRRTERLHSQGHASEPELEEARLAVELAEITVDRRKQEQEQKRLEAERQAVKVELMTLSSPIDGIVEKLEVGLGQVADPQRPVCTIVQVDPLWVDVDVLETSQVARLTSGQTLEVRYRGEDDWQDGTIIFIAPVADASSGFQRVRLEIANETNRAAGMRVEVRLPQDLAVAGPGAQAVTERP